MRVESWDSLTFELYDYLTKYDVVLSKSKCNNNADKLYKTKNTHYNPLWYLGHSWLCESARLNRQE